MDYFEMLLRFSSTVDFNVDRLMRCSRVESSLHDREAATLKLMLMRCAGARRSL